MKFISTFLLSFALCLTGCAQFTTNPPDVKPPGFSWNTNGAGQRGQGFVWITNRAWRVPDRDARDFIQRAHLANPTQVIAVVTLVKDLKSAGIWPKLAAFYPFVGGTSNSCAQN